MQPVNIQSSVESKSNNLETMFSSKVRTQHFIFSLHDARNAIRLTQNVALLSHIAVISAKVLFGLGFVFGKMGLSGTNPIVFALVREATAGPLLLLLAYALERRTSLKSISTRQDLLPFFISGLCLYGSNLTNILGLKFSNSTTASVWQPTHALFITCMAIYFDLEKPTVLKFMGIAVAAAGCLFVSLWDSESKDDDAKNELVGNLLFFLQGLCAAGFWVGQKPLLKKFPPITVLGVSDIIACGMMTCTALLINNVRDLLDFVCEDCGSTGWVVKKSSWWAIAYWIFGGSILAYMLQTWGNKSIDASVIGIYTVVQPIVAVIASTFIIALSSAPHWNLKGLSEADIGAVAIVMGLVIVLYDNRRCHNTEEKDSSSAESDNLILPQENADTSLLPTSAD